MHARFLEGESPRGPTYLNPALIGGFGKIKNFSTLVSLNDKNNLNTLRDKLGPYLAGLIEADGSLAVHDINSKAKKYSPKIIIVFSLSDKPLAEKLASVTQVGKIYPRENQGCVLWSIQNSGDVLKIIHIINGFFRSGKIFELHKCINWFNENLDIKIDILPLDSSSVDSNAWLAGFSQSKASFSVSSDSKLRVLLNFKLKININLVNSNESSLLQWFSLFCAISKYLGTSFITEVQHYPKCTFIVYAYPLKSKNKVLEYYSKYLLSGKVYLDYLFWSETFKITGGNNLVNIQTKDKLTNLKSKFFNNISHNTRITDNLNSYLPSINQSNLKGKRSYSTQIDNKNSSLYTNKAWLLTGFSDGEASFYLSILKTDKYSTGFSIQLFFEISLHKKDKAILELFQSFWGVGTIRDNPEFVKFKVTNSEDLKVVIDHFDNYPLITQKYVDFQLFKKAFDIFKSKEHLTLEGLNKLVGIKASMNRNNLPLTLSTVFPDIIPVKRPLTQDQEIKNPFWFSGFTSAEGSFFAYIYEDTRSKLGKKVSLRFSLAQHSRDETLLRNLIQYLDCGQVNIRANGNAVDFKITSFDNLINKLIPFFESYPLLGAKALDFNDFCRIAELIKNKAHLNLQGLEEIIKIKEGMNLKRK